MHRGKLSMRVYLSFDCILPPQPRLAPFLHTSYKMPSEASNIVDDKNMNMCVTDVRRLGWTCTHLFSDSGPIQHDELRETK